MDYGLWADVIGVLHALFVLFVVGGQGLMDPFGMTEFTREQIHQIFLKRYAKHLGSSEQEPIHTV